MAVQTDVATASYQRKLTSESTTKAIDRAHRRLSIWQVRSRLLNGNLHGSSLGTMSQQCSKRKEWRELVCSCLLDCAILGHLSFTLNFNVRLSDCQTVRLSDSATGFLHLKVLSLHCTRRSWTEPRMFHVRPEATQRILEDCRLVKAKTCSINFKVFFASVENVATCVWNGRHSRGSCRQKNRIDPRTL